MPPEVLIVGAGPAGSTAALVLSRAGVRARLVDRARFPRTKLCGDTLNPGTLAILRRLGIEEAASAGGVRLRGMRLAGPGGVKVEARYGQGLFGLAQTRSQLDARLLEKAIAAGADFEDGVRVTSPLLADRTMQGVLARRDGGTEYRLEAPVTIAADGRRSVVAFTAGLAFHPASPRRWAIGAYYQDVEEIGEFGEMHVRAGGYLGIAPLPGDLVNVILVVPARAIRPQLAGPGSSRAVPFASLLERALSADADLADRFASARRVGPLVVLGPLAVDTRAVSVPGLLLAGDAAGFIDPMTGDGMRFAIAGGVLAAEAALEALAHGWSRVGQDLARRRRTMFGPKWRFNRAVRRLTGSGAAVRAVAAAAPALPALLRWAVRYAGDCGDARG